MIISGRSAIGRRVRLSYFVEEVYMNIVSLRFLLFLLLVITVFFLVPDKARRYVLLAASYFFYFSFSRWLISFLLPDYLLQDIPALVPPVLDIKTAF